MFKIISRWKDIRAKWYYIVKYLSYICLEMTQARIRPGNTSSYDVYVPKLYPCNIKFARIFRPCNVSLCPISVILSLSLTISLSPSLSLSVSVFLSLSLSVSQSLSFSPSYCVSVHVFVLIFKKIQLIIS